MAEAQTAPYGSWKSPITSDLIVGGTIGLVQIALDGEDVYWAESRPSEAGRNVVARWTPGGEPEDVTPAPYNVRTRVHEYGGGAFAVHRDTLFFSHFADNRLYRQDRGAEPKPITPEAALRYADYVVDSTRGRIICVREDHTAEGQEPANTLVSINLEGDDEGGQVLVSGSDFYSSPRVSPDGSQLAWLQWNHPNMPWDGTELWVGDLLGDGSLGNAAIVAGGLEESIFQPEWSPDGTLHYVSEQTGWWNLYRSRDGQPEQLTDMEAEFGVPQWVFGMTTYGFDTPERIVCRYSEGSNSYLALFNIETRVLEALDLPFSYIWGVQVAGGYAVFIGGSPAEPSAIVRLNISTREWEVLRRSSSVEVDHEYISVPEAIEFPTEGGLTAHGLYYAPKNRDFAAPDGEKPPLLVLSHGGPTSTTYPTFNLGIQYWTSRGFAALDVNYGGSTGYGREYRQRLNGQWGVVDVDDCVNGARYLVERGDVDGERLAIRGGSAGGYTTLNALTFRDVFKAGASHFGVSDLEAMVQDTHKFESRYLDSMIGPYPERRDLYRERSSINYTDRLNSPMIFFQGLDDKVVPPNQAEIMVEALRKKGVPVAYIPFEGEGHGFRQSQNIKRALDAELYFYSRIFRFGLADEVEPVEIANI